jgi:hypothetical protein
MMVKLCEKWKTQSTYQSRIVTIYIEALSAISDAKEVAA